MCLSDRQVKAGCGPSGLGFESQLLPEADALTPRLLQSSPCRRQVSPAPSYK